MPLAFTIWLALAALATAPASQSLQASGRGLPRATDVPRLVFVSRQPAPDGAQIPGFGPHGRALATGGQLRVRERNGRVRDVLPADAFFDYSDPCVAWDGQRIVFAATRDRDAPWRIWMVRADGTGLVAVTQDDRSVDFFAAGFDSTRYQRYDDFDPCWLPDGRICFATTRWPQRAQFEDLQVTNLFVTDAHGGPAHRITAERNGGEEPSIDPRTGRVVYARWWFNRFLPSDHAPHGVTLDRYAAVEQDTINQWTAGSITPDGDGIKLAGGDARQRSTLAAGEPVILRDGTLVGVWAENAALSPAPGRTGLRAFAGGIAAGRWLAGPGTALGGRACAPAALPDGRRLVFSWAPEGSNDFGLCVVGVDGRKPERVFDALGSLELDAAVLERQAVPPVIPDEFPDAPAGLPHIRADAAADRSATTFRFDCLNVFTNAPVDAAIPDAPPLQKGLRIRFYAVVARPGAAGGDSLVFLREEPIDPSGAVHVDDIPADSPSFEQLVDAQGRVVRSSRGPAHVAGFNFARLGAGTKCVGCHTGHSTIAVPLNNWRAKWFNAAPSAAVTASSLGAGSASAAVDRRTDGPASQVAWVAADTEGEHLRLDWKTAVEVRAIVLYSVQSEPSEGTNQRIREVLVTFFLGGHEVKRLVARRELSPKGTRIECEPVQVDAVEIAPSRVTGLVQRRPQVGLAEVEAIARLPED